MPQYRGTVKVSGYDPQLLAHLKNPFASAGKEIGDTFIDLGKLVMQGEERDRQIAANDRAEKRAQAQIDLAGESARKEWGYKDAELDLKKLSQEDSAAYNRAFFANQNQREVEADGKVMFYNPITRTKQIVGDAPSKSGSGAKSLDMYYSPIDEALAGDFRREDITYIGGKPYVLNEVYAAHRANKRDEQDIYAADLAMWNEIRGMARAKDIADVFMQRYPALDNDIALQAAEDYMTTGERPDFAKLRK
jgi:hypothetical protein